MVTRLELFKKEMEPAFKIYTQELIHFTEKYECLGEMTMSKCQILILRNISIHLKD